MSKKRKTLKQKIKATKHKLAQAQNFKAVKREIQNYSFQFTNTIKSPEDIEKSASFYTPTFMIKDILKTFLIASFILASEIVIYFIWH